LLFFRLIKEAIFCELSYSGEIATILCIDFSKSELSNYPGPNAFTVLFTGFDYGFFVKIYCCLTIFILLCEKSVMIY